MTKSRPVRASENQSGHFHWNWTRGEVGVVPGRLGHLASPGENRSETEPTRVSRPER